MDHDKAPDKTGRMAENELVTAAFEDADTIRLPADGAPSGCHSSARAPHRLFVTRVGSFM